MANRYANLVGSKKISEDFNNINIGFDKVQQDMDTKAAASSPTLTGNPTAPTQSVGDNSTKIATTQYADRAAKTVQTNLDAHTSNADIHVSKADKSKWNNHVDNPDIHVTKAQKDNWDSKAPGSTTTELTAHKADTVAHVTKADHDKLNGIASGAEVNQNAFSKINDIPATGKTDTVKIVAGTGIAVTTNPADKSVNITATGTATPGKHASSHLSDGSDPIPEATTVRSGLMSAQDKQDLEDIKGQIDATNLSTTLGPGTSVINADQASAVDLTIYGQTLQNGFGVYGNFEKDSNGDGLADGCGRGGGQGTLSLETDSVKYGLKAQRIASLSSDTDSNARQVTIISNVRAGKKYVVVVDAVTDGVSLAQITFRHGAAGGSDIIAREQPSSANSTRFVKFSPAADFAGFLTMYNTTAAGTAGWVQFDGAGIYEVSEELYNRIGVDINETNIRDYLPHVDGVQHVQGVSVYHPSKNLLPSAPDTLHNNAKVNAPYEMTLNATGAEQYTSLYVGVIEGQKYTFNAVHTGYSSISGLDRNGVQIAALKYSDQSVPHTFTVPKGVELIRVVFASRAAGMFTFKNWQLELGDKATEFEPAKPQSLIIPVTLGSTPDGSVRDSAYYDHELSKWRKVQRVDWSGETPTVLATPVYSDIKGAEGDISLHPGGNQLTVETGIVQREKAKLFYGGSTDRVCYINGTSENKLSRRAASILSVYKGADNDSGYWTLLTRAQNHPQVPTVGTGYATAKKEDVDPKASYYVTYTTLDKYDYTSNVTQLDVSYKAGISATLSDSVSNVSELKTQNDRQDFADTYIQAYSENNRKDIDALVSSKGQPNGIAGLDASGKVPSTQLDLPSNLETTTGAAAKVKAHADLTAAHGATSTNIANAIVARDSAGRAKVSAPSAADDIARLDTVTNQVGYLPNLLTTAKGNTVAAINELFTNVNDGKGKIAGALIDMGQPSTASDTFDQQAAKIRQIKTGKMYASGSKTVPTTPQMAINDLAFTPGYVRIKIKGGTTGDIYPQYFLDLSDYSYLPIYAGTGGTLRFGTNPAPVNLIKDPLTEGDAYGRIEPKGFSFRIGSHAVYDWIIDWEAYE